MARSSSIVPPKIDIQIERWPIERLIPRANNPRTHSREQVAQHRGLDARMGLDKPDSGRRRRRHHRGPRKAARRRGNSA